MEQEVKKKKKKIADDNMAKNISKKPEVKKVKKKKSSPVVPVLCLIIGVLLGVIGTMIVTDKMGTKLDGGNVISKQADNVNDSLKEMLDEEAFTIETPNCNLYYPMKWKEQVRVEQVEDDGYTVNFYGTVGDRGEHFLFSILFGNDGGVLLGSLKDIPVYIISTEGEVTDEWTEEEKEVFYSMQEDVNYLLGMLEQEDGFVSAE